jgi:hypothetical protein
MAEAKNKIRFDILQNAELADIFGRKNVGDECDMNIKFKVTDKDQETVEGRITEVTSYDYDEDDPAKTAEATAEQPIAIAVFAGTSKERKGS